MKWNKKNICHLTYEQAERAYFNGVISADAWEWYCWKFSQTSISLCAALRGIPEPEWKAETFIDESGRTLEGIRLD